MCLMNQCAGTARIILRKRVVSMDDMMLWNGMPLKSNRSNYSHYTEQESFSNQTVLRLFVLFNWIICVQACSLMTQVRCLMQELNWKILCLYFASCILQYPLLKVSISFSYLLLSGCKVAIDESPCKLISFNRVFFNWNSFVMIACFVKN